MDDKKYSNKSETEVLNGLRLLLHSAEYLEGKPILLCINEFDKICSEALFVMGDNLVSIVKFYCNMIAQAIKYQPKCKVAILTGVTAVTSRSLSSFNNYDWFKFLNNEAFYMFCGLIEEEFHNLIKRKQIPKISSDEIKSALECYNGYNYKDIKLFDLYSGIKFIEFGTVDFYWKRSGLAEGLTAAIRQDRLRKVIEHLLNDGTIEVQSQELHPINFPYVADKCYEVADPDFIFNFLIQQGYLTIVKKIDAEIIEVRIPNYEVKLDFRNMLCKFYKEVCKFNPELIQTCRSHFMNMKMSSDDKVKENLKIVKGVLCKILKKKTNINERWFESFLFTVFVQHTEIFVQEKVERTGGRKKDRRYAKVLDTFVLSKDRCFLFEESMKLSGEDASKKIIRKQYYKQVENAKLPYILIGLGVGKDQEGKFNVTISFLLNKKTGNGVIV